MFFTATADTSVQQLEEILHDAIRHAEVLDLTLDNGNFVELSVHIMQHIISAQMVEELLHSSVDEGTFMRFLTKLFDIDSQPIGTITHKATEVNGKV